MRSHRGWPYPFRPQPWADIAVLLNGLADRNPPFRHMADVAANVIRSDAVDLLAGCTTMHDLAVVPRPLPDPPYGAVIVRARGSLVAPTPGEVIVEHTAVTGHRDLIARPVTDAVPLFWRFVIEKYGIRPT